LDAFTRGTATQRAVSRLQGAESGRRWATAHLSLSGEPIYDAKGQFRGYHGVGTDVTARIKGEVELRQAATVFTSTHESVLIADPRFSIITVNPAFSKITGYTADDVRGKHIDMLRSDRHAPDFYQEMMRAVDTTGFWQGEIWKKRKNGEIYPEWLTLSTVRDDAGAVINYVGVFSDITQVKQSQARLEHLAHHDALTNMPNRLVLLTHLEKAIARGIRSGNGGAVLFIDLDRFKNVNDKPRSSCRRRIAGPGRTTASPTHALGRYGSSRRG